MKNLVIISIENLQVCFFLFIFFLCSISLSAQQVSGTVYDNKGKPLFGAAVLVKNTKIGTTTDSVGVFTMNDISKDSTLVVSFVGFVTQEIKAGDTNLSIGMKENAALDEVVITGVLDARSRMESSVAISIMKNNDINRLASVGGADLLKNIAGVYVNSMNGEIRNTVYSRGVSANSIGTLGENQNGFYYVSLQEDGLPVLNINSNDLSPDFFFRNDVTINRLEAVRGGSSSISASNAPGGIFNFISKEGGFANEFKVKLGLEGDGKNPFYRADFVYGGDLKNDWRYNVGGFYRYATGSRDAGYPLNNGGQIKANFVKTYKTGSIKFYGKYLDDTNGTTYSLLGVGFDNTALAPGVKITDSYTLSSGVSAIPNGSNTATADFDPTKLTHSQDLSLGIHWKQDLGNNWSVSNNGKFSKKSVEWNAGIAVTYVSLLDAVTYYISGLIGPPPSINLPGTVTFKERGTGKVLAQVAQGFGPMGPEYKLLNSNLPANYTNNAMFIGGTRSLNKIDEFIDNFTINKKLKNGSINAGIFYASTKLVYDPNMIAPIASLAPIQDKPQRFDITFDAVTGQKFQITDAQGYMKTGGSMGFQTGETQQNQLAVFLGNTLTIAEKFNFDWAVRYETTQLKGFNNQSVANTKPGGFDGNPLTSYDDFYQVKGANTFYDKTINTFSYSAGLNYKLNDKNAVYVRYSNGQKTPDVTFYQTYTTDYQVQNVPPLAQRIEQLEAAYKFKGSNINLIFTPFLSNLSNVVTTQIYLDDKNQFYTPTPQYNSIQTVGVEVEMDWHLHKNFDVKGALTLQSAKYTDWKTWDVGTTSRSDDKIVDYTGNKAENNPDAMFTITPTYSTDKFYTFVQWRYMGNRPVNQPNAFDLPAIHQFDFGAGYNLTQKWTLSLNINNIANSLAIMSSGYPGDFLHTVQPQTNTKAFVDAHANAIHSIVALQPMAFFLSASYKF